MPREKTPIEFKKSGFAQPQINRALDFVIGGEETPAPPLEAVPQEPPTIASSPSMELAYEAREAMRSARSAVAARPRPSIPLKTHANLEIDGELWDRFKNAVFTLHLTLTDAVNDAIADKLDELERENGGPFPPRPGPNLRPGRRLR